MSKGRQPKKGPEYPIVVEMYGEPSHYELKSLGRSFPSCFNGSVTVEKYRVTVEKVEEPKEVLRERLQALWDVCDNHHHAVPLMNEAQRLGVELIGLRGAKAAKR